LSEEQKRPYQTKASLQGGCNVCETADLNDEEEDEKEDVVISRPLTRHITEFRRVPKQQQCQPPPTPPILCCAEEDEKPLNLTILCPAYTSLRGRSITIELPADPVQNIHIVVKKAPVIL